MCHNALTQTGIVENPNLKPEDEHRPTGLHSLEGVAYLLQKDVSNLEDIEILESVGAFHKSRDGAGFYLVNMKDMTCSCPGYRYRRSCRHIKHVEDRVAEEAHKHTTTQPTPTLPEGCAGMTDEQLAARKAKIDARNQERAEEQATKKTSKPKAFRPVEPEALA